MAKGTSKISLSTSNLNKTTIQIIKKTRDLKNEQYRIINENGEIILHKKGSEHEVAATVGEQRELLPGATAIHNHPTGGTFSAEDLRAFGYGAKQIVVASPEGTYILTNKRYGTKQQFDGWLDMINAMNAAGITKGFTITALKAEARKVPAVLRQARALQKTSEQYIKAKEAGKPQAVLDKILAKHNSQTLRYKKLLHAAERKIETQPYHDFYREHAKEYGFEYRFVKR